MGRPGLRQDAGAVGSLKGPSGSEPFPKEMEWGLTWRMEFLLSQVLSSS